MEAGTVKAASGSTTSSEATADPTFTGQEARQPVASRSSRSSLRERMKARREELARRTTEIFPVPRWMAVLAVELKPVPWDDTEESLERNSRGSGSVSLPTACDEIAAGTVAFYEIKESGELEVIEDAHSWSGLAEAYNDKDLSAIPPTLRERTALVDLCSDQGVMILNGTFKRWMSGAKVGISEEVEADFDPTS